MVTKIQTEHAWMVETLTALQKGAVLLLRRSKTVADYHDSLGSLVQEYAFKSKDFDVLIARRADPTKDHRRAVIGYKRAVKVALLGIDPETTAGKE